MTAVARQALVILMVVIAFGILVPIYKGFGFLDARIIAAYACLALLFVAPASAEWRRSRKNRAVLARIAIIVAWGWGMTVLILGTALVTLNIVDPGPGRRSGFIAPPFGFIAAVFSFQPDRIHCDCDAGRFLGAPIFGCGSKKHPANGVPASSCWRWHLDRVFCRKM